MESSKYVRFVTLVFTLWLKYTGNNKQPNELHKYEDTYVFEPTTA